MHLWQGNKAVQFNILGYEFADCKPPDGEFNYDANWLVCEITFSATKEIKTYNKACLLTYELAELANEMSEIVKGTTKCYISDFMEANLQFAITNLGNHIQLTLNFADDLQETNSNKFKVEALLSQKEAANVLQELKHLVAKFPER